MRAAVLTLMFSGIYLFCALAVAYSRGSGTPQDVGVSMTGPSVVLRAIPFDMPSRIGPSARFWKRELLKKRGQTQTATINVTYTGFTTQAQTAFQYAVDIWETLITTSVQITVNATFASLASGVLGSAGPTSLHRDFSGAPVSGTWYPVALAEKLVGTNLNSGSQEINASFNSDRSDWYFGTDGNTPSLQYDFVTVVMHELCHGLGFVGSMSVSGASGSWGTNGYPYIFDRFAVNGSSQQLISTFANPSTALATQLQSDNIYFNGSWATQQNGNSNPKLYAPATWQQGSSFSHLDEATFQAGDTNSLMTPALAGAESVHDPGPITTGIFQDMGWTTYLPVQLAFFEADVSASTVHLKWRTETEINTFGFYIERRAAGTSGDFWNTLGFVKGYGTTSSAHDYSFVDQSLAPGRYAYRMKQVDFGGAFEYFGNVEVEILTPTFFVLEQNYPNPFNPSTVIRYSLPLLSHVRLEIFDALGRRIEELVNAEQDAGNREVTWRANAPSGTYFYRIEAISTESPHDRFAATRKLIVLK